MNTVTIRWATEADIDAVVAIARCCWAPIYEGYGQILGTELYNAIAPDPLQAKSDSVTYAVKQGRTFVAESNGVICGFAGFLVNGAVGSIISNAVLPEYKGRGIAGLLYTRIFEELRQRGCTVASVHTGLDDGHAAARSAYRKMGFEVGLPGIDYYKKL